MPDRYSKLLEEQCRHCRIITAGMCKIKIASAADSICDTQTRLAANAGKIGFLLSFDDLCCAAQVLACAETQCRSKLDRNLAF